MSRKTYKKKITPKDSNFLGEKVISLETELKAVDIITDSDGVIDQDNVLKCAGPSASLIQDIIEGTIETGFPPYPDSLFVDEHFRFFEPKRKDRIFGNCILLFPKGCYVGIYMPSDEYQFCSKKSLLEFLNEIDVAKDPYEVRDLVKERFNGCPFGIVGGYKENEPGTTYNVFWVDERTRIYYDCYNKKIIENFTPLIVVI